MWYLPYIVVILLLGSGTVIFARGGFEKEGIIPTLPPTPTPTLAPTSPPTAAPASTPVITPVPLGTIPSVRVRGEDD